MSEEVCEFCQNSGVLISDDDDWRGEPRKRRETCACRNFNDVGDCPVRSIEIERNPDDEPHRRSHVGQLWTGAEWVNVDQARALRDWLNEVLP